MYVAALELTDFRSYSHLAAEFPPGVVALVGPNGHGKTNIVEAIAYTATLSSHRTGSDAALIRDGSQRAIVRTRLMHGERCVTVAVDIAAGKPSPPLVNGVAQRRRRDIVGVARTVVFAPEDLAIIKGDPDNRRSFLDSVLIQTSPRLAAEFADYDRAARQRAALLRSLASLPKAAAASALETLEIWDARLADHGAAITVARMRLAAALAGPAGAAYADLAGSPVPIAVDYQAAVDAVVPPPGDPVPVDDAVPSLASRMREAMVQVRAKELERGVNLIGPHRDDVKLLIGGLPARTHASHGEAWSLALAAKIAAFEVLKEGTGGPPILILDDVLAELDASRRRAVARLVGQADQVILTSAVREDVPGELGAAIFRVHEGGLSRGE
ncbi:MAG: DNA replication/repair protein RecF, partial [Propionibacteriaceae bacterium]|jgi:DNA replication and repair protein RecF|nr:DNA replication/repair protein RecF [Propionibacteriaceae bacterium]